MKSKSSKNMMLSIMLSLFMIFSTVAPIIAVQAEEIVMVTKTGSKYHKRKCGSGNYYSSTLSAAKARGLTPCQKCYGSGYAGGNSSGSTTTSPSIPVKSDPDPLLVELAPTKSFNGCKNSPVEISITGNPKNDFTFQCYDGCVIKVEKVRESSTSIGGFSSTSLSYALTFDKPGSHKVSAYNYQGKIADTAIFDIAESHSYDDGVVTQEETCEKDGIKTFTCDNCKNTYTESIKATGHTYDNGVKTKNATCISDGIKTFTCLKCSKTRIEAIPATGEHSFSDWDVSEEPTALEEGKETRTCFNCGKEDSRKVEKLEAFVNLVKKKLNLKVGKSYNLKIYDHAYGDEVKNWEISNSKVAKISRTGDRFCTIKTVKKGKCKITVIMKSGCTETCTVNVK